MTGNTPQPAGAGGTDPSMEDILASIRRILSEDDAEPAPPPATASAPGVASPDVLALDASMLVEEPAAAMVPNPAPLPAAVSAPPPPAPAAKPVALEPRPLAGSLLDDSAASAAASSVGSLLRTLANERQQTAVYRGGPTLEDLVREELRPVMKQWLDTHLPALVERLVRAEIERVVGRALS